MARSKIVRRSLMVRPSIPKVEIKPEPVLVEKPPQEIVIKKPSLFDRIFRGAK